MLIFYEQEASVPIAWAISSRSRVEDISEWLTMIYRQGKQLRDDWHVNAFMTDDASAEIEAIRFLLPLISIFKVKLTQFQS